MKKSGEEIAEGAQLQTPVAERGATSCDSKVGALINSKCKYSKLLNQYALSPESHTVMFLGLASRREKAAGAK